MSWGWAGVSRGWVEFELVVGFELWVVGVHFVLGRCESELGGVWAGCGVTVELNGAFGVSSRLSATFRQV